MGGGKKARGRTNRAKHEEAAAQKVANGEEPSAALREEALARRLPRHPGATQEATLAHLYTTDKSDKLVDFVERACFDIVRKVDLWMENELGISPAGNRTLSDWNNEITAALAAAAEGGDPKAKFTLVWKSLTSKKCSQADKEKWVKNALTQDDSTNIEWYSIRLWQGLQGVSMILGVRDTPSPEYKKEMLVYLETAAECGSATAQHICGMLKLWSGVKVSGAIEPSINNLDGGRWMRKAAKQGVKEAQFELGKLFGCAMFEGIVYQRLARKYMRQASTQGHDEATRFMKQLRMCVLCGADDARRTCSLCREVRYCDSACSRKHWHEGGVMSREGGAILEDEAEPHMHACRRTHVRGRRPR